MRNPFHMLATEQVEIFLQIL